MDPSVVHNEAASRFEVAGDGALAELVYRRNGTRFVILHTEVPDALAGHGIAGALVAAAVDHAVEQGWTIVPICPYARSWLERHPDVAATATIDWSVQD